MPPPGGLVKLLNAESGSGSGGQGTGGGGAAGHREGARQARSARILASPRARAPTRSPCALTLASCDVVFGDGGKGGEGHRGGGEGRASNAVAPGRPPHPSFPRGSPFCAPAQTRTTTLPPPLPSHSSLPPPLSPTPQISAGGKTTSLGDHETEVAAARAFDRACINKAGADARTNFPLDEYADEMDQLIRE